MAQADHSSTLITMAVDDLGRDDAVAPPTTSRHNGSPCTCTMTAADVFRGSPPSLGTACPTTTTPVPSRTAPAPRTISASAANNINFSAIDNDSIRPVTDKRLGEFRKFLHEQGHKSCDPSLVAPCTGSCVNKGGSLGLDAGLVLLSEADVRLAAYHAYLLPVWGAVSEFEWPNGVGVRGLGRMFWTNEHGNRAAPGELSAIPDSTFCIAVCPVALLAEVAADVPAEDTSNKRKRRRLNDPTQASSSSAPPAQDATRTLSLHSHALIEFKRPGALSTIVLHDHTHPRIVRGVCKNWKHLTEQLRKYAKVCLVTHQVVMDDEYAIYIHFAGMEKGADQGDDVVRFMIVPHDQRGMGIWPEDIPKGVLPPRAIRLNSRELICFLIWSASLNSLDQPPLSKDAIQQIQQVTESDKSKKRSHTPSSRGGEGERPAKRLASMPKKREPDSAEDAGEGGSNDGNDERKKRERDSGEGQGAGRRRRPRVKDTFGFENIDHEPNGYLPPRGTEFELIPKLTSTSAQPGDDSGFWDIDKPESGCESSSTTSPSDDSDGSGTTRSTDNLLPRTLINNAIAHLTKRCLRAARGGTRAALMVRMCTLLWAPNVGIVEFIDAVTKEPHTTASVLPNTARDFPLTCIVKSYFRRSQVHETDSYLGEYTAYQAMGEARSTSVSESVPAGLPAFFGEWEYVPLTKAGVPLFPLFLLENLRASPLHGITLAEWVNSPHNMSPREKLQILPAMREALGNTLRWVQEKCDTVHRDLAERNLVVVPGAQAGGPPVVAVVDWGLAATGFVLEGEKPEDWEDENLLGPGWEGGKVGGPQDRRRLKAVKTWGRSDLGAVDEIFTDVTRKLEMLAEEEEEEDEEEQYTEEEDEGDD